MNEAKLVIEIEDAPALPRTGSASRYDRQRDFIKQQLLAIVARIESGELHLAELETKSGMFDFETEVRFKVRLEGGKS